MLTLLYGVFSCLSHFQAAVHIGHNLSQNLRSIKNQSLKSVKQLFRTAERLIIDQMEITGWSTIDWNHFSWKQSFISPV